MAASIAEAYLSRPNGVRGNDNSTQDILYVVYNAEDDTEARLTLSVEAEATYDDLQLVSLSIREIGEGIYLGTASYGTVKPREAGDAEFRFDTSGGSEHITQALSTVAVYTKDPPVAQVTTVTPANVEIDDTFQLSVTHPNSADPGHPLQALVSFTPVGAGTVGTVTAGLAAAWAGSTDATAIPVTLVDHATHITITGNVAGIGFEVTGLATDGGSADTQTLAIATTTDASGPPDHGGAIGVTRDGIEGCEIESSGFAFSITRQFAPNEITSDYMLIVRRATKTWNSTTITLTLDTGVILTFAPGELFLASVQGGKKISSRWEMTFNFKATENITERSIGEIAGIAKRGFDYLWVQYKDAIDENAQCMVKKPFAAFVQQVYKSTDLNLLTLP